MMTIQQLDEIKAKTLQRMTPPPGGKRIVVGMATCGIAAGARPVIEAFKTELEKRKISGIEVAMTGCIGACRLEPMVDVIDDQGRKVTYVKMTPEKVARVVAEHLINGRICRDYVINE